MRTLKRTRVGESTSKVVEAVAQFSVSVDLDCSVQEVGGGAGLKVDFDKGASVLDGEGTHVENCRRGAHYGLHVEHWTPRKEIVAGACASLENVSALNQWLKLKRGSSCYRAELIVDKLLGPV